MLELTPILKCALEGEKLSQDEIVRLLSPRDAAEREQIFAAARAARHRASGEAIFAYGFVYLSTFCRNDCRFCAWRAANSEAPHYRKNRAEILEAARVLAGEGVHLIDLTMGEDERADEPAWQDEMAALIADVKAETGLPIMLSPGLASQAALKKYAAAGADWYACYQETHNTELFARLRQGQDYQARLDSKKNAHAAGLLIEEGALCGVGETAGDLAASIIAMRDLGVEQARAMGFVPPAESESAPEKGWAPKPAPGLAHERELIMIAALRLVLPETLIPATLDVEGLAGLRPRLDAGANLVTSLVPAGLGLAGVAQPGLDIDNHSRSVAGVRSVLKDMGLRLAEPQEYATFIAQKKAAL